MPPSERVEVWLRQWLGEHPNQALPSELELAGLLTVSRNTVRTTLKLLEAQGLVQCLGRRQGRRASRPQQRGIWATTVLVLSEEVRGGDLNRFMRSGWSVALEAGALDQLRRDGFYGLLMDTKGLSRVVADAERLPCGALVASDRNLNANVQTLREHGIATVVYGTEAEMPNVDQVYTDQEAGCFALCHLLLERGRRRLLRLWTPTVDLWWIRLRNRGYERAMQEAGRPCLPAVQVPVVSLAHQAAFQERIRIYAGFLAEYVLGRDPVDAILATTDRDVYAIAGALRLLGKVPQKDVSIVGYDNIWDGCEERNMEATVPLATVDKQNDLAGREMVRLLRERLAADKSLPARHLATPPHLIFPASGADRA